jgi:hypothetical protein
MIFLFLNLEYLGHSECLLELEIRVSYFSLVLYIRCFYIVHFSLNYVSLLVFKNRDLLYWRQCLKGNTGCGIRTSNHSFTNCPCISHLNLLMLRLLI